VLVKFTNEEKRHYCVLRFAII